jgi:16S rRNA C967 or C1407 C5-methylase (RsmB/RsmF family)
MNLDQVLKLGEYDDFLLALHGLGKRAVRLRVDRVHAELPFDVCPVPWYAAGRFLNESSVRPGSFLNYAIADYYVQDAASMLPLALLDLKEDQWICDLCAAPGGKASAIAEHLGPNGFLLANENIRTRLDVLKYSLARTGQPSYATCSCDPSHLAKFARGKFDSVLVDAPCSGQTLVGKNKRDDNAFADNQIEHCALRQKRILLSAVPMLKLGGRLVYSTCTFAIEENEEQIRWLQNLFPGCWEPLRPQQLQEWESPVEAGCFRLWPQRHDCAGGFAAGLRLIRELDRNLLDSLSLPAGEMPQPITEKARERSQSRNTMHKEVLAKKSASMEMLESLGALKNLATEWNGRAAYMLSPGIVLARSLVPNVEFTPPMILVESGNHFVPTQALAMLQRESFSPKLALEFSDAQSKQFMQGSSIANPESTHPDLRGWAVATWQSQPMGWFKSAGNRWNNHLPSWARLSI